MYTKKQIKTLREVGDLLGDDASLGLTQRLIVNDVIRQCREEGVSLEVKIQHFVNEGLKAPH